MWKLMLLLALSTASLGGQTFRAAALAGLNLSQLDGDDLLGFHQPGLNAGLRVVAVLNEHWRVGPEILFSQQGAKRNTNSVTQSTFDSFRFQTVELPIMVHYHDWRLTAEGGVAYQRLLSYRVTNTRGEDVTEDIRLRDDALVLHLGVTLDVSPRLGLNFRWSRHLTNQQASIGPRFVSRALTFRAVYAIGRVTDLSK